MFFGKNKKLVRYLVLVVCLNFVFQTSAMPYAGIALAKDFKNVDTLSPKSLLDFDGAKEDSPRFSVSDIDFSEEETEMLQALAGIDNALLGEILLDLQKEEPKTEVDADTDSEAQLFKHVMFMMRRPDLIPAKSVASIYSVLLEQGLIDMSHIVYQITKGEFHLQSQVIEALSLMDNKYSTPDIVKQISEFLEHDNIRIQDAAVKFFIALDNDLIEQHIVDIFLSFAGSLFVEKRKQALEFFTKLDASFFSQKITEGFFRLLDNNMNVYLDDSVKLFGHLDANVIKSKYLSGLYVMLDDPSVYERITAIRIFSGLDASVITPALIDKMVKLCSDENAEIALEAVKFMLKLKKSKLPLSIPVDLAKLIQEGEKSIKPAIDFAVRIKQDRGLAYDPSFLVELAIAFPHAGKDDAKAIFMFFANLSANDISADTVIEIIDKMPSNDVREWNAMLELILELDAGILNQELIDSLVGLLKDPELAVVTKIANYLHDPDNGLLTASVVGDIIDIYKNKATIHKKAILKIISEPDSSALTEQNVTKLANVLRKSSDSEAEEIIFALAEADMQFITPDIVDRVFALVKKQDNRISPGTVKFLSGLSADRMPAEIPNYFFSLLKSPQTMFHQSAISFFVGLDESLMSDSLRADIMGLLDESSPYMATSALQIFDERSEGELTVDLVDKVEKLLDKDSDFLRKVTIAFFANIPEKFLSDKIVKKIVSLHSESVHLGQSIVKFFAERDDDSLTAANESTLKTLLVSAEPFTKKGILNLFVTFPKEDIDEDIRNAVKRFLGDENAVLQEAAINFLVKHFDSFAPEDIIRDVLQLAADKNKKLAKPALKVLELNSEFVADIDDIDAVLTLFDSPESRVQITGLNMLIRMDQSLLTEDALSAVKDLLRYGSGDVCLAAVDFLSSLGMQHVSEQVVTDIMALSDDVAMKGAAQGSIDKLFVKPLAANQWTASTLIPLAAENIRQNRQAGKPIVLSLNLLLNTIVNNEGSDTYFQDIVSLSELTLKGNDFSVFVDVLYALQQPKEVMSYLYEAKAHKVLIAFINKLKKENNIGDMVSVMLILEKVSEDILNDRLDGFYIVHYLELLKEMSEFQNSEIFTSTLDAVYGVLVDKVKDAAEDISHKEVFKILDIVKDRTSTKDLAEMFIMYLQQHPQFVDYMIEMLKQKKISEENFLSLLRTVLKEDMLNTVNVKTRAAFYDLAGVVDDQEVTLYLVEIFKKEKDVYAKKEIAYLLESYYETAEELLEIVYPKYKADIQRFAKLVPSIKYMQCEGFSSSFFADIEAIRDFTEQLELTRNILGAKKFIEATSSWESLADIKLVLPLRKERNPINVMGYAMPHSLKSVPLKTFREMENFATIDFTQGSDNHADLRRKFYDFQNKLVNSNFAALELINANTATMSKGVAFKIIELTESMLDAFMELDPSLALKASAHLKMLRYEFEQELLDVGFSDAIPKKLKERITRLDSSLDNLHTLIRFIHQSGTDALTMVLNKADANVKVDIHGKKLTVANLGEQPVVKDGKIINKPFRSILKVFEKSVETYSDDPFVIIDDYVSWSCSLGEHRVEVDCDLNVPDEGGFLRIRYFEGGDDVGNELRRHYLVSILQGLGMHVSISLSESGKQYKLDAVFDKDHGAVKRQEIEHSLQLALRALHFTANLDWGFEAIVNKYTDEKNMSKDKALSAAKEIVADMADIYLAEEIMPFYIRSGTEFDTTLYSRYEMYKSNEYKRDELRSKLNAVLDRIGYPKIPEDITFGQRVIDTYYITPIQAGLASGELQMDKSGMPEINSKHDIWDQIMQSATVDTDMSMQTALTLNMLPEEIFDYKVKGYVGRLAAVSGKVKLASGGWMFVNGLKDPESGKLFYALPFAGGQDESKQLDVFETVKLLRAEGHSIVPAAKLTPLQKRTAEKLRNVKPDGLENVLAKGIAASAGEGQWVTGKVSFDPEYHKKDGSQSKIFVAPFTTPDDLDAIKSAAAVVTTGGGILSHAGITTREFGVPAVILADSNWKQISSSVKALELFVDEKGSSAKQDQGLWVVREINTLEKQIKNNDVVMVNGKSGAVKIFDRESQALLSQAQALIEDLKSGKKTAEHVAKWISSKSSAKWYKLKKKTPQEKQAFLDSVELILTEALCSRKLKQNDQSLSVIAVLNTLDKSIFATDTSRKFKNIKRRFFNNAVETFNSMLDDLVIEADSVADVDKLEKILFKLHRQLEETSFISDVLRVGSDELDGIADKTVMFEKMVEEKFDKLVGESALAVEKILDNDLSVDDLPQIRKVLRKSHFDSQAAGVKNIVFVCSGNTCRSPMAQYMMEQMLKDAGIEGVEVLSRGTLEGADDQSPISDFSAEVLAENGIDNYIHDSAALNAEDVESADLILTMGDNHISDVREVYPQSADRLFRLMEFGKKEEVNVDDPFGKSIEVYRETGAQIKGALSGVLARMQNAENYRKLVEKEQELTDRKIQEAHSKDKVVYSFDEIDDDYVDVVGGKSAKLGQIMQTVKDKGAYVPTGIAVSTNAFEVFLKENNLEEEFKQLTLELDELVSKNIAIKQKSIEEYSKKIRKLISKGTMDSTSGLGALLMDALKENGLNDKYLAVRSSAVQEDTEEAAFAGAAETYLYVDQDDLLEKIKENWMSFWLPRGIGYRAEQGIAQSVVKPAVTVQEMADAEKAGVIFTVNPINQKEEVVINASYGLGESVVSGFVQGDMYVSDKADSEEREFPFIGSKRMKIIRNLDGRGTQEVPVNQQDRSLRSLTQEEVKKLTEIAVTLEEYFGYALDIEFAITGDKIAVLQARPVTASSAEKNLGEAKSTLMSESIMDYIGVRDSSMRSLSTAFMEQQHLQMLISDLQKILKISPRRFKNVMTLSRIDVKNLLRSLKQALKYDGRATEEEFAIIAEQVSVVSEVFAATDATKLPKSVAKKVRQLSKSIALLKAEDALKNNNADELSAQSDMKEDSYEALLEGISQIRAAV